MRVLQSVVLCLVLGACARTPVAEAPIAQATVTIPAEPPVTVPPTEAATVTPQPTNTPDPTNTPSSTNTLAPPTPTPGPPGPPSPPKPVVIEGSGQTVTDPVTPPAPVSQVALVHQGESNFIVTVFKPDGTDEVMVNAIGSYSGLRPLIGETGEYTFEVNAEGNWSISLIATPDQPEAAQGVSGAGDWVSGLFNPPGVGVVPFEFEHTGERNFIVQLFCADGQESVQNEIGPVRGSAMVRFMEGPCFWDVQADGIWSITAR